jgi:hypothetical protein
MRHEHPAGALVELVKIVKTSSSTNGLLHHSPKAFDRVEVMATMGWEEMKAKCAAVVVEGRVEFVRPMDPTPIDHHHHFFLGFPEGRHHLVAILAQLLRIKVRDDFREDFGGTVLHRPNATEHHTAGDPAPGARADPRLAFARFVTFDSTLAHRTCGQTRTLRCMPPARPGQGKAPQNRFVFIEPNDLAPARLVFKSREFERALGEISRGRIQAAGRAVVTYPFFFKAQRTLSRPSWTPVWEANTVASSRQLHGE